MAYATLMKRKTKAHAAAKPATPANFAAINAAIEKHLDLGLSEKTLQVMEQELGSVNFIKFREIVSFASNQSAWMDENNLSSAADKVEGKLSQHYPSLSPHAIFRIVSQATYGWR